MTMDAASMRPDKATRESLIFGALMGALGGTTGFLVLATSNGDGYGSFPVAGALAGFAAGTLVWRLTVARRQTGAYGLALVWGAVAILLAHYLTFCFQFLYAWMAHALFDGYTDSFRRPPVGPVYGLLKAAPVLTAMSLFLVGWITVPLGAALGVLVRLAARALERRKVA